jgi:hypothetical protein
MKHKPFKTSKKPKSFGRIYGRIDKKDKLKTRQHLKRKSISFTNDGPKSVVNTTQQYQDTT